MPPRAKAKGIQRHSDAVGQPLDDFRQSVAAEIGASLERCLGRHKAETIAAECDRKRSTVYRWAGHPEDVPVAALDVLARFDSDPELLARIAGHLLALSSHRALARQAAGRAVTILEEVAPGKWGRR